MRDIKVKMDDLGITKNDLLQVMQSLEFDCFEENLLNGYYYNKHKLYNAAMLILNELFQEVCKYSWNCKFLLDNIKDRMDITDDEINTNMED